MKEEGKEKKIIRIGRDERNLLGMDFIGKVGKVNEKCFNLELEI